MSVLVVITVLLHPKYLLTDSSGILILVGNSFEYWPE